MGQALKAMLWASTGLVLTAGVAQAQSTAEAASGASANTPDVIVVTAQRRVEDLQKVPLSIAVISGVTLERQGQAELDQVLGKVGSVKVLEGQDGPTFYIRGVGTGVPADVSDPEINLSIDGVYQSQPEYSRSGLYDVARIEVLRGPQGTLYGRNALAGAVNIVTADPNWQYGGYASAGVGDYSLIQAQGAFNLPINDQLAARAAFSYETHDGYLNTGADDADVKSARLKLLWRPTNTLSFLLAVDDTHEGGKGEGEVQITPPGPGSPPAAALPLSVALGNSLKSSNPWTSPDPGTASRDTDFKSVRLQVDWDLGFGVLTLLPAYRDYSYACLSCYRSETDQNNYSSEQQRTVELRLASPRNSPIQWLAGAFYLNSDNPNHYQQLGPGADSFADSSGNAVSFAGHTKFNTESYAVFGQLTYPVLDRLRLTLGGRYSKDDKTETGYVSSETSGVVTQTTGLFNGGLSSDAFTYRAGVEFDLAKTILLYANISTGYKSGGFYQGAAPNIYKPEYRTAYEAGVKGSYFDNRLKLNADVFYYSYRDYQVNFIDFINPTSAGIFGINTVNAQGARSYGAELEGAFSLTDHDQIDGSVSPLHAKFRTLVTNGFFGVTDASGFTLPFAPSISANLGYQHEWDVWAGARLTGRVETHVESSSWVSFNHVTDTQQDAYSRTNLFLTYDSPDRKWSITGYVKNIENNAVLANAQSGPAGLETVDLLAPRTYGAQLSAKF